MRRPERQEAGGFSLAELLLVVVLLGIVGTIGLQQVGQDFARERVESASRRLALGLELGRVAASRQGRPCALQLRDSGWQTPTSTSLPACQDERLGLGEGIADPAVQLEHNLPEQVRFSSNGLVLDGGTVRISATGTDLVRCLVMSLPLGVVRVGRWQDGNCRPDAAL